MRPLIAALCLMLLTVPAKAADITSIAGSGGWIVSITSDPASDDLGQCVVTSYAAQQSRDFSGQGTATSLIWFDLTRGEAGFVAFRAPLRPGETVLQVGEGSYPVRLGPKRVRRLVSQADAPDLLDRMFDQNAVAVFGDEWIVFDTRGFFDTFVIAWDQCPKELIRIEAPESLTAR